MENGSKSRKSQTKLLLLAKLFGLLVTVALVAAIVSSASGGLAGGFFAILVIAPIAALSGYLALIFLVADRGLLGPAKGPLDRRNAKVKLLVWLAVTGVTWFSALAHVTAYYEIGTFFENNPSVDWLQLPLSYGSFLLAAVAPICAVFQFARLVKK